MDALDQVIEILGSQEALASNLKIRSPSISEWRKRGRVPAERCLEIERLTENRVTRYDLRPDVFGKAAA
jgi:DNA-binding transcriptional regulator YdaS (Cro superfamily)